MYLSGRLHYLRADDERRRFYLNEKAKKLNLISKAELGKKTREMYWTILNIEICRENSLEP